ncbi:hypothetical protein MTR_6g076030 [Medicago truncatula]|uniref:Uncharacterized protein n=1 Tax=Medicago truncatula TaxID=3880 RepID=G7KJS3_MEDTR|nr:hypothetical protein MTR_6g076030 [Medicago truncatula]
MPRVLFGIGTCDNPTQRRNLGSMCCQHMRSLRQYSFKKPDLLSLRKLGKKVVCTDDFYKQHGNFGGWLCEGKVLAP